MYTVIIFSINPTIARRGEGQTFPDSEYHGCCDESCDRKKSPGVTCYSSASVMRRGSTPGVLWVSSAEGERAESHSFRFFDLFNNQIITKMSRKTLKQQPKLLEQVFFILLLFRWDWDGWLKQLQMDQIFSNFLRRTKRTAKKFRKLIWANKKN